MPWLRVITEPGFGIVVIHDCDGELMPDHHEAHHWFLPSSSVTLQTCADEHVAELTLVERNVLNNISFDKGPFHNKNSPPSMHVNFTRPSTR